MRLIQVKFRKYTATEDVNYLSHTSRSAYRSESFSSRHGERGRSSSSEIVAVSLIIFTLNIIMKREKYVFYKLSGSTSRSESGTLKLSLVFLSKNTNFF